MISLSRNGNELLPHEMRECHVCKRPASGYHYGAFTCFACKMFFRRINVEQLDYQCKLENRCCDHFEILPKCRACRWQRCKVVGMMFVPRSERRVPYQIQKESYLKNLLKELLLMENKKNSDFMSSYSSEDPSLEDILNDPTVMRIKKRDPEAKVTGHEWAFLESYSRVVFMLQFDFMKELSFNDKKILFTCNTLRAGLLSGAMKTFSEGRDCLLTPSGEDVYPEAARKLFQNTPEILNQICCLPPAKLIELRITQEEYLLLSLIFFCNPAASIQLSENAKHVLSVHQEKYSSALMQYCRLEYQHSAPSRFTDLLSIIHVINRSNKDLQYVSMMFQCLVPRFPFKRLVADTYISTGHL